MGRSLSGSAVGESGDVDAGWDRGEGLLDRFSSGLPDLLVAELESGDVPSRAYDMNQFQFFFT